MGIKEEQLPRGRWESKKNSFPGEDGKVGLPRGIVRHQRKTATPTTGDHRGQVHSLRGEPNRPLPPRYAVPLGLRKKSSLQGLAGEVLAIYESIKEEQLPPIRV